MASLYEQKQELQVLIERMTEMVDKADAAFSPDVVQMASQLGRFDLVSLLIASIGIVLVLGGLFAFGYVRGAIYATARKEAEDVAERRLNNLLRDLSDRLSSFEKAGARLAQPSSTPSTMGAEKATEAGEFTQEAET